MTLVCTLLLYGGRVKPDNASCAFAFLVLRLTLGGRWCFSNRVLKFGCIITLLQGVIISGSNRIEGLFVR